MGLMGHLACMQTLPFTLALFEKTVKFNLLCSTVDKSQ